MADSYVAISQIANDYWMQERVKACATQQVHLGNIAVDDPIAWTTDNRYIWASSPMWGDKWDYALATHPDDPNYEPGKDDTVITDADVLATVQALAPPQVIP